jgi:hypothetical protein
MAAMAKRISEMPRKNGTVADTQRGTLFREHEPAAYEFPQVPDHGHPSPQPMSLNKTPHGERGAEGGVRGTFNRTEAQGCHDNL